MTDTLPLDKIKADATLQARASLDPVTIAEYAELYESTELPPLEVFEDDSGSYWLADGWHRYMALQRIGATEASVVIHKGIRAEAKLYAAGANTTHGLRRKPEDTKRAVLLALEAFAEQGKPNPNNVEVGLAAKVSEATVRKYRPLLEPHEQEAPRRRSDGVRITMPNPPAEPITRPTPVSPATVATVLPKEVQKLQEDVWTASIRKELASAGSQLAGAQLTLSHLVSDIGELGLRKALTDTVIRERWQELATYALSLQYWLATLDIHPDEGKAKAYAQAD